MTERNEFARVRREGRSMPGRFLVMATLGDDSLQHFKLGIITSRKVGKAVTRNKIRRRLRGILSKHGERIDPGRYLVMIARNRAGEASYRQLEDDWLRLAGKLGILEETAS
jgi:ribonuclease P protein component